MKIKLIFAIAIMLFQCNPGNKEISTRKYVFESNWEGLKENINRYHNDTILLAGFFKHEFENVALYESYNSEKSEALWLNFTNQDELLIEKLANKKVKVLAVIDSKDHGHLAQYLGSMNVINISEE